MSSESPSSPPRFKQGDRVRVRAGVSDPDNPDLPIGRWCGAITEVDADEVSPAYLIRWDARTRQSMPEIFVKRCQRDELEIDLMWLDEKDLEADDGANLPIELPTAIVTRPLRLDDQDDRLRGIFGLTSNDPVPNVDEVSLRLFHAHLVKHMDLPFEANWVREDAPPDSPGEKVTVLRLQPPEEATDEDGLICAVKTADHEGALPLSDLDGDEKTVQGRLLEDYTYWFANWPADVDVLPYRAGPGLMDEIPEGMPQPMLSGCAIIQWSGAFGAIYGATLTAIDATHEGARTAILIGSGIMAGLLGLTGRKWGTIVGAVNQSPRAPLLGLLLGVLLGGFLGVLMGALAIAYGGSIPGSIVGTILGGWLAPRPRKTIGKFLGGFLGACVGGIILAMVEDREKALPGLIVGGLVGMASGIFLILATLMTLGALMSRRR